MFVDASNIRELIREYDFIIDGTDNFPAKFLINDACVLEKNRFLMQESSVSKVS